jgi:GNAT superfamily N-acetyltransferase
VSPLNVSVPARDFRSGATILSLADLGPYAGPMSLVRPLLKNFYLPTVSYYPLIRELLDITWLFDAAVEALGLRRGTGFLRELLGLLAQEPIPELDSSWKLKERLEAYLRGLQEEYRIPLSLQCAVERYRAWERDNPLARPQAREQHIMEMHRLYRLESHGDMGRYTLFRHTYFAGFGPDTTHAFDRLLRKMFRTPEQRPTHMVELSDLQATLAEEPHRLVFSHMVFPAGKARGPVEVQAVGDQRRGHVVVTSHVKDRRGEPYTVREPIDPAEIGRIYRLYLEAGMPLSLGDQARYLLAIDGDDRIVGGVCYKLPEPTVAHMDGLVISSSLRGNGLGGELLEDFVLRLRSQGVRALNTHFISRPFLRAHGFQLDQEWGGLVRFLDGEVHAA